MRGRPSIYTDATADALVSAIGEGLTIKAACARAGVSVTTLRNWVNRDIGGMAGRVSEAQLRAAALFGTPITFTQRPPVPPPAPTSKSEEPKSEKPSAQPKAAAQGERTPAINITVTWEITPSGAAALAEMVSKLDRLGALAVALSAIFPNGGANSELTRLLKALSASS